MLLQFYDSEGWLGDSYYDCWEFYTVIVGECCVGLGVGLSLSFVSTSILLDSFIAFDFDFAFEFYFVPFLVYAHAETHFTLFTRNCCSVDIRLSFIFTIQSRASYIVHNSSLTKDKENKEIIKIRFLSDWSHSQNMPGTTSFRSIYVRTDQIDQLPFTSETSRVERVS